MPPRNDDAYDAQMWTYREHLRGLNRRLAEDYIQQNRHYVVAALDELAKAAPVSLAIQQFHHAIRNSPARNAWPMLRRTKGALIVPSNDTGNPAPWPWRRTNTGNLRYDLAGYLLFSPWPRNVRRGVRNHTIWLEGMMHTIQSMPDVGDVQVDAIARQIFFTTRRARWLIEAVKTLQQIATPESVAALDRWSADPARGSNMALRISQGTMLYRNGAEHCRIDIPDGLMKPLRLPTTPDVPVKRHWVQAGARSYL